MDADSWTWNFGDGSESSKEAPSHTFESNENYSVSLMASNATTGCKDTIIQEIFVQKPEALFFTNPDTFACVYNLPSSQYDFISFDSYPSEQVANYCRAEPYSWNFGDHTDWKRTSSHKYSYSYMDKGTGKTKISLVVEDSKGCTDTLTKEYNLYEPIIDFELDTTSGCYPKFDVQALNLDVDETVKDFYWIFNNKDTIKNKLSTSYTFEGA
jgi:PKD repeat protein